MTPSELAIRLDNSEYPFSAPQNLLDEAEKSGLVIVAGYSDDTAEFHGAITGSLGIKDGDVFHLAASGVVDPEAHHGASIPVTAHWDQFGYHWFFSTTVERQVFTVREGDEGYCMGLVFSLKELNNLNFGVTYLNKEGKTVVDKGLTQEAAILLQESVGGHVVQLRDDLVQV